MNDEKVQPEIVIIKRGGHGEEDGHHGGMWKIAYADFMTAMMALFLVLWLVNSTDEQTLSQIATYFNPLELTDRTTSERGVQNKHQAGTGREGEDKSKKSGNTDDAATQNDKPGKKPSNDEALFTDPYDVLAKLAAKASRLPSRTDKGGDQQAIAPMASGDAFRDPFDPKFRFNSQTEDANADDVPLSLDPVTERDETPGSNNGASDAPSDDPRAMPFADKLAQEAEEAAELAKQAEQAKKAENASESDEQSEVSEETARIKTSLDASIEKSGLASLPDISVEQTADGVLISLTDQADFEMFALSSAEPKPELIVLMEELARILTKEPGSIVIRGHTDARPFRSKTYDNWRLSTARAHIAHYMLLRGGLPKARIEKIEGYADRSLKVAEDPFAAQNRRIEILVRPEKT